MGVLDDYSGVNWLPARARSVFKQILDTTSGHDHDGVNSKEITATVGDGGVTNAKLADDVKVGSLAALNTTDQDSVSDAINEVVAQLVDASDNALTVRVGSVQLAGGNVSPVLFQDDTAATVTGTETETFDATGVGSGGTIIANPDGNGDETATLEATQGTSVSGTSASTNITAESDDSFAISVDGDAAEDVTLTLANCDTGDNTASEMQTKIQALGGNKASVTVAYSAGTGSYTVTSPTYGTDSAVVITAPSTGGSIIEELELGATLGTETAGTGDCADLSAVTADELVTLCNGDMTGITASAESGSLKLTSDTTGRTSSIVVGNGTLNTLLGVTNTNDYYGGQGLGYSGDMDDANYIVMTQITGVAEDSLADIQVGILNKATDGFELACETAGSTANVDVLVVGVAA